MFLPSPLPPYAFKWNCLDIILFKRQVLNGMHLGTNEDQYLWRSRMKYWLSKSQGSASFCSTCENHERKKWKFSSLKVKAEWQIGAGWGEWVLNPHFAISDRALIEEWFIQGSHQTPEKSSLIFQDFFPT